MDISSTGYWSAHDAHERHVNCKPLAEWLIKYLSSCENEKI